MIVLVFIWFRQI